MVDFPKEGHVQGGIRPAIVVQNNAGNAHSPTVHVMPLTSVLKSMHLPTHVPVLPTPETGLRVQSMAQAEGMQPVDKTRMIRKLGCVDNNTMKTIRHAIMVQLNMNGEIL